MAMSKDLLFVDLTGERKLLQDIDAIPDVVRDVLKEKIKFWTETMRDKVLENITSRLNVKSGRLLDAVKMEVIEEGLRVNGHVWVSGAPYAMAQEKGAVIPPHEILPRDAKVLAFYAASGNKVFAARVFHPGGTIPPHYFMRDAYRFVSPKITRGLRYYIVERIRRQMRNGA